MGETYGPETAKSLGLEGGKYYESAFLDDYFNSWRMASQANPFWTRGVQLGISPDMYLSRWNILLKDLKLRPTSTLDDVKQELRHNLQFNIPLPINEGLAYLFGISNTAPAGFNIQSIPQGYRLPMLGAEGLQGGARATTGGGAAGGGVMEAGRGFLSSVFTPSTTYQKAMPTFESPAMTEYYQRAQPQIYNEFMAKAFKETFPEDVSYYTPEAIRARLVEKGMSADKSLMYTKRALQGMSERISEMATPEKFSEYMKNYDWMGKYASLTPAETGFYPQRYAPRTRWLGY